MWASRSAQAGLKNGLAMQDGWRNFVTMDQKAWIELSMAVFTALMACFTAWLGWETRKLEKSWRETSKEQINTWRETSKEETNAWRETSSKQIDAWFKTAAEQIGVETWMALEARFDTTGMKRSRKLLAEQLEHESRHDQITEETLELFESIGAIFKRGLLDEDLAYSSFSYHAVYWWEAAKFHIFAERKEKRDDTLFEDFEHFAKVMRERDHISKIDPADLKAFLQDEKALRVVYPA